MLCRYKTVVAYEGYEVTRGQAKRDGDDETIFITISLVQVYTKLQIQEAPSIDEVHATTMLYRTSFTL
jgi:hypothetical protein